MLTAMYSPGGSPYSLPSPYTPDEERELGDSATWSSSSFDQQPRPSLHHSRSLPAQPSPLSSYPPSGLVDQRALGWNDERAGMAWAGDSHPAGGGLAEGPPYLDHLEPHASTTASPYASVGSGYLNLPQSHGSFGSFTFGAGSPSSRNNPSFSSMPLSDAYPISPTSNDFSFPASTQMQPQAAYASSYDSMGGPARRTSQPDISTGRVTPSADSSAYAGHTPIQSRRVSLPSWVQPSDRDWNGSGSRERRVSQTGTPDGRPPRTKRDVRSPASYTDVRRDSHTNGSHPSRRASEVQLDGRHQSFATTIGSDDWSDMSGSHVHRPHPLLRSVSDQAPSPATLYTPTIASPPQGPGAGAFGERNLPASLSALSVRSPPSGPSAFLHARTGTPSNPVSPARSCFPVAEEPTTTSLMEVEGFGSGPTDWETSQISQQQVQGRRELQRQRSSISSATSSSEAGSSSSSFRHPRWPSTNSTTDLRERAFSVGSSASSSEVLTPDYRFSLDGQHPETSSPSVLFSYDQPREFQFDHPSAHLEQHGQMFSPFDGQQHGHAVDPVSSTFRTRASRSASAPGPSLLSLTEYSHAHSSTADGLPYGQLRPVEHINPGLVLGKAPVTGDEDEDEMATSSKSEEEESDGDESEQSSDDEGSTPKSHDTVATATDAMDQDEPSDSDGKSDDGEDASFNPAEGRRRRARQSSVQVSSRSRSSAVGAELDKAVWFPGKLYAMAIAPESRPFVDWSPAGNSLIIPDGDAFAKEVLSRYFKHSQLPSFLRQLNIYGFSRTRSSPLGPGGESSKKVLEVAHPLFHRDRPDLIEGVVRHSSKTNRANKNARGSSASTESPVAISPASPVVVAPPEAAVLPPMSSASPLPAAPPSPRMLSAEEMAVELERANATVTALQDRLKEAARKNGELDVAVETLKAFILSKVPKEQILAELSDFFSTPSASTAHSASSASSASRRRPPPTSAPPSQLRFDLSHLAPPSSHPHDMPYASPSLSPRHGNGGLLSPSTPHVSSNSDPISPGSGGKRRRLASTIDQAAAELISPSSERTPTGRHNHSPPSKRSPSSRMAGTASAATKMGSIGASSLAARRRGTRAGGAAVKVKEEARGDIDGEMGGEAMS